MDEPVPKFEVGDLVVPRANPLQAFRVQARVFKQTYEGTTLWEQQWKYMLLNEDTRYLATTFVGEDLLKKAPSRGWDKEEV